MAALPVQIEYGKQLPLRHARLAVRMLIVFLFASPLLALSAEDPKDPWDKVRNLKTGTELRVIRVRATAPILAQFAELTEDSLVVVVRKEQVAIPREQVMRVESRLQKGYVTTETKASNAAGGSAHPNPNPPNASPTSSTAYSTGVAIRDKIDYETIYRRPSNLAKAKK